MVTWLVILVLVGILFYRPAHPVPAGVPNPNKGVPFLLVMIFYGSWYLLYKLLMIGGGWSFFLAWVVTFLSIAIFSPPVERVTDSLSPLERDRAEAEGRFLRVLNKKMERAKVEHFEELTKFISEMKI